MKKSKGSTSQLPVPRNSNMDPAAIKIPRKSPVSNVTRSAEDIPRRVQLSVTGSMDFSSNRIMSPALSQEKLRSPLTPADPRFLTALLKDPSSSIVGVRYLTEELIRKTSKQDNLSMVSSLNLTLSKDGNKRIKYIENLESLKNLQILNLSGNLIEKIEKLDKLSRLIEINLSFNFIRKIEGLDMLCRLQVLNLTGNQIEHIPQSLGKKLKTLRVFKIAKNNLSSLNELSRLKPLPDLAQLSIADNPLAELPHSRLYVIFHIRTLDILDGQPINAQDRQKAKDRFSMDEIIKLEKIIEQLDGKYQKLEEEHKMSEAELKKLNINLQNERQKMEEMMEINRNIEEELNIKNELLKKKTKELHRACEKHYQLEQELAFHKIDAKFASLGEEPQPDQTLDTDDNEPLLESPYIGKALFTPQRSKTPAKSSGQREETQLSSEAENLAKNILLLQEEQQHLQQQLQQQQHKKTEMDNLLAEKQRLIDSAGDSLKLLHEQLFDTESKVEKSRQDLKQMTDLTSTYSAPSNNDIKMAIRQKLADKMKTVNLCRKQAAVLEKEVNKAEISIKNNMADIGEIQWQLKNIPPTETIYDELCEEIEEKEQQIKEDTEVNQHLQEQLAGMIAKIASDTSDIQTMEQQLYCDDENSNMAEPDRLRQNLGVMVDDLQSYLKSVKLKNQNQTKHIEQLLDEREAMEEKIKQQGNMVAEVNDANQEINRLTRHLTELQGVLGEQQRLNEALGKELQMKAEQEKDLQEQIKESEMDLKELKQTIEETERRAQAEIQSIEQQLIAEKENTLLSTKKALLDIDKDRNVQHIISELEKSKMLNTVLKDKLDENKKKYERCCNDFILPGDLKKKMKHLSHSLKTGKRILEVEDNKDFVSQIFLDLQKGLQDKINQMKKEIEERKDNERKMREQNEVLNEKLNEMNKLLAETKMKDLKQEAILNAKISSDKKVKTLQEELQKLRKQLTDSETQLKLEKQKSLNKQIVVETSDNGSQGSMNSEEKRLFEELQRELVELKKRMLGKEEQFVQQLASMEAQAAHWQSQVQQQQQQHSEQLQEKHLESNLHKAQQQASIQVISQDLENARRTADQLQELLNERQKQLQSELDSANMTEQMIAGQEEELGHLYNILEQQRDEIYSLNGVLEQLNGQNQEDRGPSYDAEVNRLRDEVNSLRETLAMQSSYLDTMPTLTTPAPISFTPPQRQPCLPGGNKAPEFLQLSEEPQDLPRHQVLTTGPNQTSAQPMPQMSSQTPQQISPPPDLYFQSQPVVINKDNRNGVIGYIPSHQPSTLDSMMVQPGGAVHMPVSQFTADNNMHESSYHAATAAAPETSVIEPLNPNSDTNYETDPYTGWDGLSPVNPSNECKPGKMTLNRMNVTSPFQSDIIIPATSVPIPQSVSTRIASDAINLPPKTFQPLKAQPVLYEAVSSGPPLHLNGPSPQNDFTSEKLPSYFPKNPRFSSPVHEEYCILPQNPMLPENSTENPNQISYPLKSVSFKQHVPHNPNIPGSNLSESLQPQKLTRYVSGSHHTDPSNRMMPHQTQQQIYNSVNKPHSHTSPTARNHHHHHPHHQQQQPSSSKSHPLQRSYTTTRSHQPQLLYSTMKHPPQQPYTAQEPQQKPHTHQLYTTDYQLQQPYSNPSQQSQQPQVFRSSQPHVNPNPQPLIVSSQQPQQLFTLSSSEPQNLYSVQTLGLTPAPANVQPQIYPGGGEQYYTVAPIVPMTPAAPAGRYPNVYRGQQQSGRQHSVMKNVPEFSTGQPTLHPTRLDPCPAAGEEMFCNIPQHHNLECLVDKLQHKLARWKSRFQSQMQRETAYNLHKRGRLVHKLKEQLEERRTELEGLDLAIERQKRLQEKMKTEERELLHDHRLAKQQLMQLRHATALHNRKRKRISHRSQEYDSSSDSSIEQQECYKKQSRLQDEIKCLEKTLFKRQTQLKDADNRLKEFKKTLNEAKLQAEETVTKHDTASSSMQSLVKEAEILEERANKAGMRVVAECGNLRKIKTEYREMQQKRNALEKILTDIHTIIIEKDSEFQKLDNKVRSSNHWLHVLKKELAITSQAERETTKSLMNSKETLENTKQEINKLRQQGEYLSLQVKDLNNEVCSKQKQLSAIQQDLLRKKSDIESLLSDAQSAVNLKQKELKAAHEKVVKLEGSHLELATVLRNRKGELDDVTKEVEKQKQAVTMVTEEVKKSKEELQNSLDQRKIVQANIDRFKTQTEQKNAELEKIFKTLSEAKHELNCVSKESELRQKELHSLEQNVAEEQSSLQRLATQRSNLQDTVSNLSQEHRQLEQDRCEVDAKLNEAKLALLTIESTILEGESTVNSLREEIQEEESTLGQCRDTKAGLETELASLQHTISERKKELNSSEKSLQELETQTSAAKQQSEKINTSIIDSREILERLTSEINNESIVCHNLQTDAKQFQDQLSLLTYSLDEKTLQMETLARSNSEAKTQLGRVTANINAAEKQLLELKNKINLFQKHSTEIRDVDQLKNELKVDVKLLKEQKVSLELHLKELKKDIAKQLLIEQEPERGKLQTIIRSNEEEEWHHEALKEKLVEEQDHVRLQLKEKMQHHFDVIQSTKQQSQGILNKLKHKVNALQDVFISYQNP